VTILGNQLSCFTNGYGKCDKPVTSDSKKHEQYILSHFEYSAEVKFSNLQCFFLEICFLKSSMLLLTTRQSLTFLMTKDFLITKFSTKVKSLRKRYKLSKHYKYDERHLSQSLIKILRLVLCRFIFFLVLSNVYNTGSNKQTFTNYSATVHL